MLEILKLLEINSRQPFVNLSIIFRLILLLFTKKKLKIIPAGDSFEHYEMILFESIFNRAPPAFVILSEVEESLKFSH